MPKILIVDDDQTIRSLYEFSLSEEGYETKTAENGLRALEAFKEFNPDFMIVDIVMPDMNGWEFIEKLKAYCRMKGDGKTVPYIVMTGENFLSQNKTFNFERDKNFCGYFEKMMPVENIISFIKEKLE